MIPRNKTKSLHRGSAKCSSKNYLILPVYIICALLTLNVNARTLQSYLSDVKENINFSSAMKAMEDFKIPVEVKTAAGKWVKTGEMKPVADFSAGHRYLRVAAEGTPQDAVKMMKADLADLEKRGCYAWEGVKHIKSILDFCGQCLFCKGKCPACGRQCDQHGPCACRPKTNVISAKERAKLA